MKKRLKTFLLAVVVSITLIIQLSPVLAAASTDKYVHEESFTSDYNMSGLLDSMNVTFNAGDWKIDDAVLTLCFSVTPLIHYDVSNFSVSLNGQRFYSSRIPLTKGQAQQTKIQLPLELIQEGSNQLKLESYIRTNDSQACSDDISKASWMTVLKDSSVAISYTPKAQCQSVADFYKQFTSIDALENDQSAVFIRPDASDTELTASALVLSGISANASLFYDKVGLSAIEQESALNAKKYALYITKYDKLQPAVLKLLSKEQVQSVQDGKALLALVKLGECNVLVVTGSNDAALLNAGRMLGNQAYMKQILAAWRWVSDDEDVMFKYNQGNAQRLLTENGSYVNGPFRQNADFFVQSSPNRVIDSGSQVNLKFRYSENLDFNRSLVTVYINDTPIGSKKLTKEMAKADSVSFNIPANLNIKGNFSIKVAFDLEIADLWCTFRQEEMPWAYISNESTIKINTVDSSSLLFEYYPGPFVNDGRMNNVTVILPGQPGEADLSVMRSVILTLGRYQKDNSGSLQVTHATNIGNIADSNVIDIGRLEKNPVVQQINGQLYFQFSPKGTTIRSNEKMLIEPNYGATLGTAQLLYSPYSTEKRALLVITGVSDKAMLNAAAYVGLSDNIWKVAGDGFVADSNDVQYYRFKADNASVLLPGIGQSDLLALALVGFGVLVLLVIASLLLVIKHRRRK